MLTLARIKKLKTFLLIIMDKKAKSQLENCLMLELLVSHFKKTILSKMTIKNKALVKLIPQRVTNILSSQIHHLIRNNEYRPITYLQEIF